MDNLSRLKLVVSLGLIISILSGCGAGIYRPAAENFSKALDGVNTQIKDVFRSYPNEVRVAYLKGQLETGNLSDLDSHGILCLPVYKMNYNGSIARWLQLAAIGLANTTGESPKDFSSLAAATASTYAIVSEDVVSDDSAEIYARENASKKLLQCLADAETTAVTTTRQKFVPSINIDSGSESAGAGLGAIIATWNLFEPIANGGLTFLDQRRREAAVKSFIIQNSDQLKEHIGVLNDMIEAKNSYERALAAADYIKEFHKDPLTVATFSNPSKIEALNKKASVYDAIAAQSSTAAFDDLVDAVERLSRVANGKPSGDDLAAAIKGFGSSIASLQKIASDVEALEEGGDKNDDLKAAIKNLRESF